MPSQLFNVQRQLIFYGAYHHNKTNVMIHILCVPILLMTAQVMIAKAPLPAALVDIRGALAAYLPAQVAPYVAKMGWEGILFAIYLGYYFALEPVAALIYTPQLTLSTILANNMSHIEGGVKIALVIHVLSWIAQFIGHGVYEKRAPALLDNLLGAVVLAPFFVHLEILFKMGYNKSLNEQVERGVLKEIGKIRAKEQKKS